MLPDGAKEEFASTFKEWHYLAGGGAIGLMIGFLIGVYVTVKLLRTRARN